MTTEWDANIQAISNILDRDRAEIAKLKEQVESKDQDIEVLCSGHSRLTERVLELEAKLIERLAEINEKDAQLEKARLLDITRCGHIGILEGQIATALREREGR